MATAPPGARWSRTSPTASWVDRKLSRRSDDCPASAASESGIAKITRSYIVSVSWMNARPSST